MRPEEVRADPWDRLRLVLTWGGAALLPVWIVVFATFAQLAQSRAEADAQTLDVGQGIVVVVGSDDGPGPLVQALVAATGLVAGVGVVGAAGAWLVARRAVARTADPLDASLYAGGATWSATRRRDDGTPDVPPTPPDGPDQSQLDSTG